MQNVMDDYTYKLRDFLMNQWHVSMFDSKDIYFNDYDPNILQGFVVWNLQAYLAKEYDFTAEEKRVDFFVIPLWGARNDINVCECTQYMAINVDIYSMIDQTGQRLKMLTNEINEWHREQLRQSVWPLTVASGARYMVMPDGVTQPQHLSQQPYVRMSRKYKLDCITKLPPL